MKASKAPLNFFPSICLIRQYSARRESQMYNKGVPTTSILRRHFK